MFTRIKDGIVQFFREESFAERKQRMLPGAMYGALAASAYMLVSAGINAIFFRDLHLSVDWFALIIQWVELVFVMGLAGAIVGWFTEHHEGVVYGAFCLAVLIMAGNLIASAIGGRGIALLGQSALITIIPLVAAGLLLAGAYRFAIRRHMQIKDQPDLKLRRKMSLQLVGLVLVVGMVPGVLSLFGTSSLNTVRAMNRTLQNYATDRLIEQRFPYENLPGLKEHFGMDYTLVVRTSSLMTRALDVTIRFEDGYTLTCLVPLANSNEQLLVNICNEGTNVKLP